MIRTEVGYAGGTKANPTYRSLGDHTEAIQIHYDPTRITYEELLRHFWNAHNAAMRPYSRQYMSLILTHDERQKKLAERSKVKEAFRKVGRIHTEIRTLKHFYSAEDYHQKNSLRRRRSLTRELRKVFRDERSFTDSTLVARLNGWAAGYGSLQTILDELPRLGLDEGRETRLREILGRLAESSRESASCASPSLLR